MHESITVCKKRHDCLTSKTEMQTIRKFVNMTRTEEVVGYKRDGCDMEVESSRPCSLQIYQSELSNINGTLQFDVSIELFDMYAPVFCT